jgi:hypothetical protein
VWRYEEIPEQRQERFEQTGAAKQELLFARIRQSAEQENLHWVGVEPGRRSMLTAPTFEKICQELIDNHNHIMLYLHMVRAGV